MSALRTGRSTIAPVRIIGIDPGSRTTGYGVIDAAGPRSVCVAFGRIVCGDGPLPGRLLKILREVERVVGEHRPQESAIEEVFVRASAGSALVLGQARGAAICALAGAGLPVEEYAPARIKASIVGHGRAEKRQIQHMVGVMLALDEVPPTDAADALAVALCHAHWRGAAVPVARRTRRSGLRFAFPELQADAPATGSAQAQLLELVRRGRIRSGQ